MTIAPTVSAPAGGDIQQQSPAPLKKRCAHPSGGCTNRVVKIIGDCRFCQQQFCSTHRHVEAHECANIDACKQDHFQRNSAKLSNEKTVATKLS